MSENPRVPPEPTSTDIQRRSSDRELSTIALHGVLAGLCPLIPFPFVDDIVLRRVRRSLGTELLGSSVPAEVRVLLAGARPRQLGCVGWLLLPLRLAVKLVIKLFRRLTIFLSIKEALDTASRVLHEGWLLAFARHRGDIDRHHPEAVRWAVEQACETIDPRPLEQSLKRIFRGSRRVLHRAARMLVRDSANPAELPLEPERSELGNLVDRVGATLASRPGYLEDLERSYVATLRAVDPGPFADPVPLGAEAENEVTREPVSSPPSPTPGSTP